MACVSEADDGSCDVPPPGGRGGGERQEEKKKTNPTGWVGGRQLESMIPGQVNQRAWHPCRT
ncbi:hypothetical protein TGAM01_v207954 [Trichoderma gamsii]|uniref:Uncharacterized protein n=1 Tax=Trichoderma gamsii TaxID=398673 RepID=A0A2P4ZFW3_9HYPO|nr:hypothetical protein TGAM01_v207954 [Trichoderma gamsii]PON23181.1 hypothetical protein TGAM01_v207954 [Trichoderma gamsii]